MKLRELVEMKEFEVVNLGVELEGELGEPFCCDLLSIAMGKAPAGSVWVTVMGNVNTIAVASLTETACIILAEGVKLDQPAKEKAKEQKVTVLETKLPAFEAAFAVYQAIHHPWIA